MLTSPRDFAALQDRGTMRSHPLLSARTLRTGLETTRFGLATGRVLGSAVVRNRVRRRLREALRTVAPDVRPGWDVLLIARSGLVGIEYDKLIATVRGQLARAGVIERE